MNNNDLTESFRNPSVSEINFTEFESKYSQTLGIDEYQKMFGVLSAVIEGMKQARTPVSLGKITQVAVYLENKVRNIKVLDKLSWEALLKYVYIIHEEIKKREENEKSEVRLALKSLEQSIAHRIATKGAGVFTDKKPGSDIVV